jgi:uncharacterized OB-fold protein
MSDGSDKSEVKQDSIVLRQVLEIPQRFATGPVMGRFLRELRDNKRIMANRCGGCGRFQLPPREVCAVCRKPVTEFVEVGPEGVIASYDIVYYASPDPLTGESREAPYTTVNVLLDGVVGKDTLWHLLNETDPAKVRRGLRVRAVFNEKRTGSIHDIRHFEIIGPGTGEVVARPREAKAERMEPGDFRESFVVEGKLALPYQYFAGDTGSRFLIALRDEKKILGQRCAACNKVIVPPRATCDLCLGDLRGSWVELADSGVVTAFTVISYEEPYQPRKPPYVLALVKLGGADTPFCHIVAGLEPAKVAVGMKVRAVFAEKRVGSVLDISHFEPVG